VAVHLYHLGGLLADSPAALGLTNAASELRMRGTETRSADDLSREIESLGATITTGCGNNSTFTQASGLAEDLPRILELVADVTLHPSFPSKEWDGLKPRLLAEIDQRTDHWTSEISTMFREAWYDGTSWETNSLGRRDVVEKATADALKRAYFERLGAKDAVLAVFGDVDPARVRELVTKDFKAMPGAAKTKLELPKIEPQTGKLVTKVSNKPLAAIEIGLGPTPTRDQPEFATLQVLAEMLGAFPSGWLPEELRGRGPGLVYAVSAFQFAGLEPGFFGVLWNADYDRLDTALGRTVAVLDRARKEPASSQEVERSKAAVLAGEFSGKAVAGRSGQRGRAQRPLRDGARGVGALRRAGAGGRRRRGAGSGAPLSPESLGRRAGRQAGGRGCDPSGAGASARGRSAAAGRQGAAAP
jgi:zinc protease